MMRYTHSGRAYVSGVDIFGPGTSCTTIVRDAVRGAALMAWISACRRVHHLARRASRAEGNAAAVNAANGGARAVTRTTSPARNRRGVWKAPASSQHAPTRSASSSLGPRPSGGTRGDTIACSRQRLRRHRHCRQARPSAENHRQRLGQNGSSPWRRAAARPPRRRRRWTASRCTSARRRGRRSCCNRCRLGLRCL